MWFDTEETDLDMDTSSSLQTYSNLIFTTKQNKRAAPH